MFRLEKALEGAEDGDGEGVALPRDGALREDSAGRDLIIVSYTSSEIAPFSARLSSSCHFVNRVKVEISYLRMLTFLMFRRERLLLIIF